MDVRVRLETEDDYREVEELTREAFWNLYVPGCDEHYLCHVLRGHRDFIKELDFVAEADGRIVGSIMYSKSVLIGDDGDTRQIVSFGPLCVHPDFQRRGIGSLLIDKTKAILGASDIPAIVIYGDPHNYCKHGFKNGMDCKVSDMDGDYPLGLLVLELKSGFFGNKKWKAMQSDVFKYGPDEAAEFDKGFARKEKKWQYSQELFRMQIRSFLREAPLEFAST